MVVIFLLLCILICYASMQVIIQTQTEIEKIRYIARLRTAFWGLIVPLCFHIIFALNKIKGKQWSLVLVGFYILGIGLIILSLFGSSVLWKDVNSWFGKNTELNPGEWFFWLFNAYLLSCIGAFCTALYKVQIETDNYRLQKLSKSILIIFVWASTLTVIFFYLFAALQLPTEELLPYIGNIKMLAIIFTIQRFQPEKILSPNLFSSLSPLLPSDSVLVSPDKSIQWINKDRLALNGFTKKEIIGKSYEMLFVNPEIIEKEIKEITKSPQYSAFIETECNTSHGKILNLRVNIMGLRNELNDITAYLLTFNQLAERIPLLELLQNSFNLSNREKEVASLLLQGCRYSEISDKLFISSNTIKTHARNIYLKTNTVNHSDFQHFCNQLMK